MTLAESEEAEEEENQSDQAGQSMSPRWHEERCPFAPNCPNSEKRNPWPVIFPVPGPDAETLSPTRALELLESTALVTRQANQLEELERINKVLQDELLDAQPDAERQKAPIQVLKEDLQSPKAVADAAQPDEPNENLESDWGSLDRSH